jgi:hypothetical protein
MILTVSHYTTVCAQVKARAAGAIYLYRWIFLWARSALRSSRCAIEHHSTSRAFISHRCPRAGFTRLCSVARMLQLRAIRKDNRSATWLPSFQPNRYATSVTNSGHKAVGASHPRHQPAQDISKLVRDRSTRRTSARDDSPTIHSKRTPPAGSILREVSLVAKGDQP